MRQLAVSCDGLNGLVVDRLGEPLECLAMRLGELSTQQHVGSILVLVSLFELRLNAEPVERTAYECCLDAHSEQPDLTTRLQPYLAERRRQDVGGHDRRDKLGGVAAQPDLHRGNDRSRRSEPGKQQDWLRQTPEVPAASGDLQDSSQGQLYGNDLE